MHADLGVGGASVAAIAPVNSGDRACTPCDDMDKDSTAEIS